MDELTKDQLQHWREILAALIGPYALIMLVEDVQQLKNKMQSEIDCLADETSEG